MPGIFTGSRLIEVQLCLVKSIVEMKGTLFRLNHFPNTQVCKHKSHNDRPPFMTMHFPSLKTDRVTEK